MKNLLMFLMTTVAMLQATASVADTTLLRFDLTHYEDWIYHRPGVELTNLFIQQGNVNLFVSETGANYTLESPTWQSQGMDSVKIYVFYKPHLPYQATKVSLQIDILDNEHNAVSTTTLPVPKNVVQCDLETTLPVPLPGEYTILFSAPKADVDNCACVRTVMAWPVTADQIKKGDVNGDGEVDVMDANILINIILGKDEAAQYGQRAYIDGDDIVDVADVNAVINIILAK